MCVVAVKAIAIVAPHQCNMATTGTRLKVGAPRYVQRFEILSSENRLPDRRPQGFDFHEGNSIFQTEFRQLCYLFVSARRLKRLWEF